MAYFLARGIKKGKNLSVLGDFIVQGEMTYDGPEPSHKTPPTSKFERPEFRELVWILPSKTNIAYGAIRAHAEGMGYETQEHYEFPPLDS